MPFSDVVLVGDAGAPAGAPLPSVLFATPHDRVDLHNVDVPEYFTDLNLDQIIAAVIANWADYDLGPFFHAPLSRVDAIRYRQVVFQDLDNTPLCDDVRSFSQCMRDVRAYLNPERKYYYHYHKAAWFLHAVDVYCEGIKGFSSKLATRQLKSTGLCKLRDYLAAYIESTHFTTLVAETNKLKADLAAVRYSILIKDNTFTVWHYEGEPDYSTEIEGTFAKFQQGSVANYLVDYRESSDMNHIEAKILEFVARLNPELFSRLDDYCRRNSGFIDQIVATFDREVQFYIAYLDYIAKLKSTGLSFCYPRTSDQSKALRACATFDLALAQKLVEAKASVVCNDFCLTGKERLIIVSGPNQGGKTTFARMVGQLHYLACLGCPVPGREAQLYVFDHIFTHFEREEKVENLRGKLDDLVRVHRILDRATPRSIIVFNEIFTSTTIDDETFLSKRVMDHLIALDLLGVWVTFADELASYSEKTISMVSSIDPANPAIRTFKVVRRPADGLAYAMAIAEKYRLTYVNIKERIAS